MSRKKPFVPKIVTGNALIEGNCLFMMDDGTWSNNVRRAAVATTQEDADALLEKGKKAEANNEIVDLYLVDVDVDVEKEGPFPRHIRERIRVEGPTVDFEASSIKKEEVA